MTRATVGGINSEDNLWYPLAVDSRGIAQIDTSGIPESLQWEYGAFNPVYQSTDQAGEFIVSYYRNLGRWAKLGEYVFLKFIIQTSSVVITNPRGNLRIGGIPFTWENQLTRCSPCGGSISSATSFKDGIPIFSARGNNENLSITFQCVRDNVASAVLLTDLTEHSDSTRNQMFCSFWGRISSTDDPPPERFVNGILQETGEIPTDTP